MEEILTFVGWGLTARANTVYFVGGRLALALATLGSQGCGLEACQCVTALLNGCSGRDAGWRMEVVARRDSRQPLLEPFEVGFGLLDFGIDHMAAGRFHRDFGQECWHPLDDLSVFLVSFLALFSDQRAVV